jgi:hypothetical protein
MDTEIKNFKKYQYQETQKTINNKKYDYLSQFMQLITYAASHRQLKLCAKFLQEKHNIEVNELVLYEDMKKIMQRIRRQKYLSDFISTEKENISTVSKINKKINSNNNSTKYLLKLRGQIFKETGIDIAKNDIDTNIIEKYSISQIDIKNIKNELTNKVEEVVILNNEKERNKNPLASVREKINERKREQNR